MYVCGFTSNRSFYPSTSSTQPVPVPAFSTIERYKLCGHKNYDTEILHGYAVSRVGNAMAV